MPGLLCDERLWRHQAENLADLAGRVLIPDVTGEGTVAGMARGVLEAAPERFALAGLSMGGYVSLEIMRQAPERVEGLALLDTSARADTPEQTEARLGLIELARRGRFDEVWRGLLPKVVHPDRLEEPGLRSAVREMAHAVGPEGFERQERAIIGRPDSRPDLPVISCPTLVLCGRDDALTPPHLHEELAERIPGARLVQIDHCGHLSTLERPEAVTRAMRAWLEALANRPAEDAHQGL
ncbi:MAG: Beta-ketoadipate enol-lactone hydrolase [uncultured Rubrobacteraceae bacterium]|uniref:Beta-ketoadipate enol-lactone hydrolase n=1 Tax=uncultured Rubrobacteraceae bacterium TaxID=349277 RepID=A0A6J4R8V6_9ACTN|nr:MAG: Beta-ketoadipate enol-lactone hydrolase [uncultured Rubrobacteraceae bacterium]